MRGFLFLFHHSQAACKASTLLFFFFQAVPFLFSSFFYCYTENVPGGGVFQHGTRVLVVKYSITAPKRKEREREKRVIESDNDCFFDVIFHGACGAVEGNTHREEEKKHAELKA